MNQEPTRGGSDGSTCGSAKGSVKGSVRAGKADAPVTVLAPAKINLFLHIVGRREDERHELESIFAFADIGDRLRMAPADDFSLALTGPFAKDLSAGDNLVLKAAKALAARVGPAAFPVKLELEKNLPVAAGIGGGSADAAAVLRGLSALWGSALAANQLFDLALSLGADVPACLAGVTARVTGTGEFIEPSPRSADQFHAVLVNPRVPLSTAAVFQRYRTTSSNFSPPLAQWPDGGPEEFIGALAGCRNDLSDAATTEAPIIGDVLRALEKQQDCRLARMSGSGATCFALFDDRAAAELAARGLRTERPEWWVTVAMIGRSGKETAKGDLT